MDENFTEQVAWKTLNLLMERKALLYTQGVAFYVWERPGRVVVAFDPSAISVERVDDGFAHALSTRMHGRVVARTNSRGVFLQVGYEIPSAPVTLDVLPLDFASQPSPYHMPIGMTGKGPLWLSLIEGDSFLIAGSRGNGKSGLTHGMIQALLHGGQVDVYAWDGKRGAEFGRYAEQARFHYIGDARKGLARLSTLLAERLDMLRASGYPNILMHNEAGETHISPIAFVVDEIAELDDQTKETIKGMVKLYRAAGLYPILCTNDPVQSSILVKTNLVTRICFRVPSWTDSMTVLNAKGAESLPQSAAGQPGRGMLVWRGKLTEFQAFRVSYPRPNLDALRRLEEQEANTEGFQPSSIESLAESIRGKWNPGMSKRKVAELLGKPYGGSWAAKIDQVVAHLAATTTTERPLGAVLGLEMG